MPLSSIARSNVPLLCCPDCDMKYYFSSFHTETTWPTQNFHFEKGSLISNNGLYVIMDIPWQLRFYYGKSRPWICLSSSSNFCKRLVNFFLTSSLRGLVS